MPKESYEIEYTGGEYGHPDDYTLYYSHPGNTAVGIKPFTVQVCFGSHAELTAVMECMKANKVVVPDVFQLHARETLRDMMDKRCPT